jgi:formate dehydrogenase subunit gamma
MPPESQAAIAERTQDIISGLQGLEGPLLPILLAVQDEFGHVPDGAIPVIAERLNIGRAEVHGVASFYHDLRKTPAGKHVVKICRAEACQSMGADDLVAVAEKALGIEMHGTTADGKITLEPVFCLGLCACGPAAMVDGEPVGRVDAKRLAALLKEARS